MDACVLTVGYKERVRHAVEEVKLQLTFGQVLLHCSVLNRGFSSNLLGDTVIPATKEVKQAAQHLLEMSKCIVIHIVENEWKHSMQTTLFQAFAHDEIPDCFVWHLD